MKRLFSSLRAKLLLTTAIAAIGFTAFAFSHHATSNANFATDYFQYSGTNENNSTLTSSGSWTYLSGGLPGTSPCSIGTNIVCVVNVADASLPPGPTKEAQFASYLSTVSGGAKSYVDSHFNYQKP